VAVDSDLEKLYSYIYQNTPENSEKPERFLSFLYFFAASYSLASSSCSSFYLDSLSCVSIITSLKNKSRYLMTGLFLQQIPGNRFFVTL